MPRQLPRASRLRGAPAMSTRPISPFPDQHERSMADDPTPPQSTAPATPHPRRSQSPARQARDAAARRADHPRRRRLHHRTRRRGRDRRRLRFGQEHAAVADGRARHAQQRQRACSTAQPLSTLDEDGRARVRGEKVGFVFQSFQLLPSLTALENVMLPLELRGDADANRRRARSWRRSASASASATTRASSPAASSSASRWRARS